MANNEGFVVLSGELENSANNPFDEFFKDHPSFVTNLKPSPSFKQVDFKSLEDFLEIIEMKNISNRNFLNISYSNDDEAFKNIQEKLKDYGIISNQDHANNLLILKYEQKLSKYSESSYILKFSGRILLLSDMYISSKKHMIFDHAVFLKNPNDDNIFKIIIGDNKNYNKGPENVFLGSSFFGNIDLQLNKISKLWFSEEVSFSDISITGRNNDLSKDQYCDFNIANQSIVYIESILNVNNVNCINNWGNVNAKFIKILYNDKASEIYNSLAGTISSNNEFVISHPKNLNLLQYGLFVSNKLDINSLGGIHNAGKIIYGKSLDGYSHKIAFGGFYNYLEGIVAPFDQISSNLEIITTSASGNLGAINAFNLTLDSLRKSFAGGSFYNNGNITVASYLNFAAKTFILQDVNGTIMAQKELVVKLEKELNQPYSSKSILSRGGVIKAVNADFDIKALIIQSGLINISNSTNTNMELFAASGGYTQISGMSTNGAVNVNLIADGNTKFEIGCIDCNITGFAVITSRQENPQFLLPSSQQYNSTGNNNTISIGGNAKIGAIHVDIGQKLHINGESFLGLPKLSDSDSEQIRTVSGKDISSFNSFQVDTVIMKENSMIVIGKDQKVYVTNLEMNQASIEAIGEFKVRDQWSLNGKISFSGNIEGPSLAVTKNIQLQLSETHLVIDGDLTNSAQIEIFGNSFIKACNFYNLGNILGKGSLKIDARRFIMSSLVNSINLAFEKQLALYNSNEVTVYNKENGQIVERGKIELTGKLIINAEELVRFDASLLDVPEIYIESKGYVIILPVAIYEKIWTNIPKGHIEEEKIENIISEFKASEAITIVSKDGTVIYSSKFYGKTNLISNGSVVTEVANNVYSMIKTESWKRKGLFSTNYKSRNEFYTLTDPIFNQFFGQLSIKADNIRLVGIETDSPNTFITAGSEGNPGLVEFAAPKTVVIHDLVTKVKKRCFSVFNIGRSDDRAHYFHQTSVINILKNENGFYGKVEGTWIQFSTKIEGQEIFIIAKDEIKILSDFEIIKLNRQASKIGLGVWNEAGIGGASVGVGLKGKEEKFSELTINPVSSSLVGEKIILNSTEIDIDGAFIKADTLRLYAKKLNFGVSESSHYISASSLAYKLGINVGFTFGPGQAISAVENLSNQNMDSQIATINTAFAAVKAYVAVNELAKAISSGGMSAIFSAGAWIGFSMESSKSTMEYKSLVPTVISAKDIGCDSDTISMKATQIFAFDAYFHANKLNIDPGEVFSKTTMKSSGLSFSLNTDLKNIFGDKIADKATKVISGLKAGMIPTDAFSVAPSFGKGNSESITHINAKIQVSGNLTFIISGEATIKGAQIEAKNLFASFDSLVLESIQDVIKNEGFSASLGISGTKGDKNSPLGKLSGFRGSYQKENGLIINEVAKLIGTESATVIVAKSIHLIGAMIANAKHNPDGSYTDEGKLYLEVADLYIKHLYNHDNGIMVGSAFTMLNNDIDSAEPSFGYKSIDGVIYSTVGNGNIKANNFHGDQLNRDLGAVKEHTKIEKMEVINAFFTSRDIPSISEFSDNLKSAAKQVTTDIKDVFLNIENYVNSLKSGSVANENQAYVSKEDATPEEDSTTKSDLEDQKTSEESETKTTQQANCPGDGPDVCSGGGGDSRKGQPVLYAEQYGPEQPLTENQELEKFRNLVPKKHINAKEINILKDAIYEAGKDKINDDLLKDAIYETGKDKINNYLIERHITDIKFEINSGNKDDKRGYYGVLFSRTLSDGSKVYFEVNKGTDFGFNKEFLKDLGKDDLAIEKGNLPEQLKSASIFHEKVMNHIGKNNNLYSFGHSLGFALSQLLGAKYTEDYRAIVGVEGPGMLEIVNKHLPNTNLEKLRSKLSIFNSYPNAINSHGTSIVDPIFFDHPGNKIPTGKLSKMGDQVLFGEFTYNGHQSESTTQGFDENGPIKLLNVKTVPFNYNKLSSKSQITSFYDYDSNPGAWDRHFETIYNKNKKLQGEMSFDRFKEYQIAKLKIKGEEIK